MAFGWKVVYDGKTPPPGAAVAPDERLSWGRTVGLGAQHVVAMFGATFVFPLIMGLNAQLAIMLSGIATILFLLIVQGKVPSYLGTSASFVGGAASVRRRGQRAAGAGTRRPGRPTLVVSRPSERTDSGVRIHVDAVASRGFARSLRSARSCCPAGTWRRTDS